MKCLILIFQINLVSDQIKRLLSLTPKNFIDNEFIIENLKYRPY